MSDSFEDSMAPRARDSGKLNDNKYSHDLRKDSQDGAQGLH